MLNILFSALIFFQQELKTLSLVGE